MGAFKVDADAQKIIQDILADPAFGHQQQVTVRKWREICTATEHKQTDTPGWDWLFDWWTIGASVMRGLLWVIVIALAAVVLYQLAIRGTHLQQLWRDLTRKPQRSSVPLYIGGLRIAPQTLPEDITAAARQAWNNGDHRAALSVLYRGAIVSLVQTGLCLPRSSTEDNVLARATAHLAPPSMDALTALVRAWQAMAYAHRSPAASAFDALLQSFEQHLAKRPSI
ncbi:MAG: DUF4129 domain-containing protein [Gammaproteobacteria bacterium]|nr:DUF4129 domain-containing protein [Gammaproteobacteria bacterium]